MAELTEPQWERQPGETNKAFAAFCTYRDLRNKRSLSKVAEKLDKKSKSYISVWSKTNRWVERVRYFDDDEDRQNRIRHQESIEKMNERQAQQAETFQKILFLPVTAFSGRISKNKENKIPAIEDLSKLSTIELLELIGQMSKNYSNLVNIERIARGMPTEIGRQENTVVLKDKTEKIGELIAGNEKTTEKLTELVSAMGDAKNGKPGNDGNVCDEG
jgi:hypothetical protein